MIYGIQFLKKINNHGIQDETAEDILLSAIHDSMSPMDLIYIVVF